MTRIVYNEQKGFCVGMGSIRQVLGRRGRPLVKSVGFEQLPWDDVFLESGEDDADNEVEDPMKKLTKSERKEKRLQKKVNAARRRKLQREQENAGDSNAGDSAGDGSSYAITTNLKRVYNKILTLSGESRSHDCKLFQYHSTAVYRSDLDLLWPEEWLNDNNISLMFELIYQNFLKPKLDLHKFNHQVQLLNPSLVQLFLHFPPDNIEAILPLDDLKNLKFIFLPINFIDNDNIDFEDVNNGDHWSLALFSVLENRLYVYDSMNIDDDDAEKEWLGELTTRLSSCKSIVKGNKKIDVVKMLCDQQDNFDDCGVYLIMIACYLVKQLLFHDEEQNSNDGITIDLDIGNVRFNATAGRLYMMELIYKLYRSIEECASTPQ